MLAWELPEAAGLQAAWQAEADEVRRKVVAVMRRCVECRPGAEVTKHDDRGRRGGGKRPGGAAVQQSLDDQVYWAGLAHGRWDLVLPWAVVQKLKQVEHVPNLPVARAAESRDREGGGRREEQSEEQRIAAELNRVVREHEGRLKTGRGVAVFGEPTFAFVRGLAAQYLAMPVQGGVAAQQSTGCKHSFYYGFEGLPKASNQRQAEDPHANTEEAWRARLRVARELHDHRLAWMCEIALRGRPVRLSNFYIRPLHTLLKVDGTRTRVFEVLTPTRAVPLGPVEMEGEDYSSPSHLRKFLNSRATGVWHAGERQLQLVVEDCKLTWDTYEVEELAVIGRHAGSGGWFTATCAVDFRGEVRVPDAHGVFTLPTPARDGGVRQRRFKLRERDKDEMRFHLGMPEWHPEVRLVREEAEAGPAESGGAGPGARGAGRLARLREGGRVVAVKPLFEEFLARLHDICGGFLGYQLAGWMVSYGASPEIFAQEAAFPGYWLYGQQAQGKGSLARWVMKGWGYPCVPPGVSLEQSTVAGGETVMQQYADLPAWFDEAQGNLDERLKNMLKGAYNRIPPTKRVENLREVLTSPLVAGVATCGDAQTRSRYGHHAVSEKLRLPRPDDVREFPGEEPWGDEAALRQQENYDWMQAHQDEFWVFGRYVLEHRAEFVREALAVLADWLRAEQTRGLNERAKLVHGVYLAGFVAMTRLLGLTELRQRETVRGRGEHEGREWRFCVARPAERVVGRFREFLVEQVRDSATDTQDASELDQFFKLLDVCFAEGDFGESRADLKKFFHVRCEETGAAPGMPADSIQFRCGWRSYVLCLHPERVFQKLRERARHAGAALPLRQDDIRRHMCRQPYWDMLRTAGGQRVTQVRFGGSDPRDRSADFWCLALDRVPQFGHRPAADEEWAEFCQRQGMMPPGTWHWEDPRLGPLYQIVRRLEQPVE